MRRAVACAGHLLNTIPTLPHPQLSINMPKPKGKKVQEDVDDMDVDASVDDQDVEDAGAKSKKGKGNNKKEAPTKGKQQDKKVQEDSDEDKPKGGKQQQKKKDSKKLESDEELEEEPQQKNKKVNQKEEKGKSKSNKKVESDEEDTTPKANKKSSKKGDVEEEPTQKKGGKQQKKGAKKDESEDEEEPPQVPSKQTKKKSNKKEESDEDEEPVQKKGGKQAVKKGSKKEESDEEEEEEEPIQKKGGKKANKKVESDEEEQAQKKGGKQAVKKGSKKEESDQEEEPVQKKGGKQLGKKGSKKVDSDDDEPDQSKGKQSSKKGKAEEPEEVPKKGGKQQKKKGNTKGDIEEEEEPIQKGKSNKGKQVEESDEEEVPQKGKQAAKKNKKPVSEDEESEEEPTKKGGKQAKKGNKNEGSDEEPTQKAKQPQKRGGKKVEPDGEDEVLSPKGKQPPKKGGKKVESEDEKEEEEEDSEEEVTAKKGSKSQSAKKPAAKEKKEEEVEQKVVAAGMVSKKNKKNKKKGGKKAESEDSEPEVKGRGGAFAGLDVEEEEEEETSKPKGKKKPNKAASNSGFAGLEVEDDEEDLKPKGKKQTNNKAAASGGFAGLEVEGEEEDKGVVQGMEALSIKEKSSAAPKQPKVKKAADDTRSKKEIRMQKKNAARQADQPQEEVKEKTAEELEDEAAERYNRAQEMKGREPPAYVHLRNSEEVRSKLGNDIKVDNYTLQVPGRTLLTEASFTLAYGHRYGFVGRNGLGKSSLLQKIADRDGIQIANHLRVLYVEQEVPGDDTLPIQYVLKADVEREWLLQEEKVLVKLEADDAYWMDNPDEKRCYGLKEIYERLRDIESEKAVSRASAILVGLGFDANEIKTKPSREFSGGWRMRISLARALFCRPEVLLLDEPTNHLDLHACFWLERYLSKWKSTLLVVSHEATFLNEIVDHIIEIRNKGLITYKGNYWAYLNTREVNEKTKEKLKDRTDKEKARLKEVIQRTSGKAGASGKDKKLAKIQDVVIERDDPSLKVSFPEPDVLPPPLYQFQDVTFGYDPSKPPLFKNLEFGMDMDSRIALVGLNGVGKSTLMKLMAGELKESSGYISRNRKARIARFSQHSLEQLNPEQTPAQYLDSKFGIGSEHTLRQHLGRFGISGNLALNKIDTLSGGQKSRVVLAELAWAHPHILFLDEPSNHLDLDAIEALAKGLDEFTGGVVLISHNQRLISLVCKEIWVVTKAGTVDRFNGEFDDYKEDILAHMDFAGIDEEEEVDEEQEREKEKEKRKAKKAEKEEKEDLRPKKGKKTKK